MSLATVDRVVNRREGVRAKTVARVEAALAKLGYRADVAAARPRPRPDLSLRLRAPDRQQQLYDQSDRAGAAHGGVACGTARGFIDILHVDVFDPDVLAGTLEELSPAYQGVAVIALDHPRVRAAIDDLSARGIAVVTLVSDAPSARRLHYVGIDNPAAGRTAATLMGRFLSGREGSVAVIAGSLSLRDHTERQFGFHQILTSEHPRLAALPVLEGRDDSERTRVLTAELLERQSDLLGIYSCGAGNRGIAEALEASGRGRDMSGLRMS